jgi:hypothetical protein
VDNVHQGFAKAFRSFKVLQERYPQVLAAAISFQKTHDGKMFCQNARVTGSGMSGVESVRSQRSSVTLRQATICHRVHFFN